MALRGFDKSRCVRQTRGRRIYAQTNDMISAGKKRCQRQNIGCRPRTTTGLLLGGVITAFERNCETPIRRYNRRPLGGEAFKYRRREVGGVTSQSNGLFLSPLPIHRRQADLVCVVR